MWLVDNSLFYESVLYTLYNMWQCPCHPLTLYWQRQGWSGLMMQHLGHAQQKLQIFSALWKFGQRSAWRSNVTNWFLLSLSEAIVGLVPVVRIHGWLLLWALWYLPFCNPFFVVRYCNGAVLWLLQYAHIFCPKFCLSPSMNIPART